MSESFFSALKARISATHWSGWPCSRFEPTTNENSLALGNVSSSLLKELLRPLAPLEHHMSAS